MFARRQDIDSFNFKGLEIWDYTSSLDCSSSLAVVTVPPSGEHPPAYSKKSDKYYLVNRGFICFTVCDQESTLGEGDFCLVRRGEVFSYRNLTQEAVSLTLLHTPPFDPSAEVFADSNEIEM